MVIVSRAVKSVRLMLESIRESQERTQYKPKKGTLGHPLDSYESGTASEQIIIIPDTNMNTLVSFKT